MSFLLSFKRLLVSNFDLLPNIPEYLLLNHVVFNSMQFLASQFKVLFLKMKLLIILNVPQIDIVVALLSESSVILLALCLRILDQLLCVVFILWRRSNCLIEDGFLILHDILYDVDLFEMRHRLLLLLFLLPDGFSNHDFEINVCQTLLWTVA